MSQMDLNIGGVQSLAETLWLEGRLGDSQTLYRHLHAVASCDAHILQKLVEVMVARGQIPEALGVVAAASQGNGGEWSMGVARWLGAQAMERFNALIAAGDAAGAADVAEGLAKIAPTNVAVLNAAMECNLAIGRGDAAADFAQIVLSLDPAHAGAMATAKRANEQSRIDNVLRALRLATSPGPGTHPLIQLRDIHDAVSLIQCGPMAKHEAALVDQLLAAAKSLSVGLPPGDDLAGWEKHYRLALDALEIPLTPPEASIQRLFGETRLMTVHGDELSWDKAGAYARRQGAQIVFFVAADIAYVSQYARVYVKSLRKHCDVPFLVVVHVIGGADRLAEVAELIGETGPELLLAGDQFDAGAVATKCYDTPPKGLIAKPVAHYQCVRFLRLSAVLQAIDLPVFVSDIDLLLQREVSDLLERCAAQDIVFNENLGNTNAGSRITANLLLLKPSRTAELFLNGLENYLARALSAPEVTRWIDQFGLLIARNEVIRTGAGPSIGYFDTSSDINNLMYCTYQKNPFRFLSLYHGFDMASLESEAASPIASRAKAG